jgi:hypothetical protein
LSTVYMHSQLVKKFNKEPHSLISLSLSLSRYVHIRARVSAYAATNSAPKAELGEGTTPKSQCLLASRSEREKETLASRSVYFRK